MADDSIETRVALLEHMNEELTLELAEMKKDLREVRDIIVASKGSWKTLVALGTVASSMGAAAHWVAEHLWKP